MRLQRFCFLVCLATCLMRVSVTAQPAGLPGEVRAALAEEMTHALRAELLDAWYPRAVDTRYGGFLSRFDAAWQPEGSQEKMIVTQARHVWTTARAALFFPEDTTFLPMAAHGFAFLRDVMWDPEDGGFFWLVTQEGAVQPNRDGRVVKQAYGNAFGIYALAAYYDASRDPEALRLAQAAFRWLDAHAHDPVHGGYFQFMERNGTPMRAGFQGTPPKDQNSSIHLLEAFFELYRVWPDAELHERLREMLLLIRDTITTGRGYLTLFAGADWRPVSYRDSSAAVRDAHLHLDHVSFGHDVETAYLMLEASEALGGAEDARTLASGKHMVDHALRTGWDEDVGGLYDMGYYFREADGITILRDTKNWWAQAEALNTLLLMGDHFPEDPLRYHDKFVRLWTYVKTYLIDHERGGWYEGGLDKEPRHREGAKGHIWKGAYHDARSLMNCIQRLQATPEAH